MLDKERCDVSINTRGDHFIIKERDATMKLSEVIKKVQKYGYTLVAKGTESNHETATFNIKR